jgi:hypothetical protein
MDDDEIAQMKATMVVLWRRRQRSSWSVDPSITCRFCFTKSDERRVLLAKAKTLRWTEKRFWLVASSIRSIRSIFLSSYLTDQPVQPTRWLASLMGLFVGDVSHMSC